MAEPAVVVLCSEDFGSIEDMLIARGAVSALVLYRVRPGELAGVLANLCDGDEVCLVDDPQPLVEHRLRGMARRAGIDPMTGVLDRASFLHRSAAELPAALLAINLDRFTRFNDQHGHMVGDEARRARALRHHRAPHRARELPPAHGQARRPRPGVLTAGASFTGAPAGAAAGGWRRGPGSPARAASPRRRRRAPTGARAPW